MELRDYIKIIGRYWITILVITLGLAAVIAIWSEVQPIKYDASATVVVNKPDTVPQRTANYFLYDKYYSIQASSLYADTLTAWLSSASTAKEIYEKAGYPVPNVSIKSLGKIFKPRRLPPVTIDIDVIDTDQSKAQKLADAAVEILNEKTQQQQHNDDPDNYFTIINGATVIAQVKQDVALNTLIGLIAGFILSLIIAFTQDYLRRS